MIPVLRQIEFFLPNEVLTNEQLASQFPEWSVEKIAAKTGISQRRLAGSDCASDLAVAAAEKLFKLQPQLRADVDFLILCTQTPDYLLPTTACLVQDRLGLLTSTGALDVNQGCSGFVYSLGLAHAIIHAGQARNVLVITADTYTRLLDEQDKTVRTIFGDGAAATWIEAAEQDPDDSTAMGPFIYGTDGSGADNLIVRNSGMRKTTGDEEKDTDPHLRMNGAELYTFTLKAIPQLVRSALDKAELDEPSVDHFVFHQANQYMLESLRRKCRIPEEKFFVGMRDVGNTVSSSIPIALRSMQDAGILASGQLAMLVGFGVGYSWGATFVRPHWT